MILPVLPVALGVTAAIMVGVAVFYRVAAKILTKVTEQARGLGKQDVEDLKALHADLEKRVMRLEYAMHLIPKFRR